MNFNTGFQFDGVTGLQTGLDLDRATKEASFAINSGALDQVTLEDDGAGKARIKAGGISGVHLGTGVVATDHILDGTIQDIDQSFSARVPHATDLDVGKFYTIHSQAIPVTTTAVVEIDTVSFDFSAGNFNPVTFKWTAAVAGIYSVTGTAEIDNVLGTREMYVSVLKNNNWVAVGTNSRGTTFGAGIPNVSNCAGVAIMQVGDELELAVWHNALIPKNIRINSPVRNQLTVVMHARI